MEEQTIINTIVNIFNGSNCRDWQRVHDSFSYDVFLDYFSLNGTARIWKQKFSCYRD